MRSNMGNYLPCVNGCNPMEVKMLKIKGLYSSCGTTRCIVLHTNKAKGPDFIRPAMNR